MRQLRPHVGPLLIWSLICALFLATLLLGRERLPSGDFAGQFHAFGRFQAQEMTQGRLPLWLPGSQAGTPFAADTQAATFYLPRWLTIALSAPWHFPLQALQLEAAAHIWLAGLFTYALAYDLTRRREAALLAAVAFGLGGYLTAYPLQQLAVLESITWLPLVLWLLRRGVHSPRPVPWLSAAALALGLSALAGHPQTWLHICYLAAAYYLFLAIRARWAWPWVLGLGLLVGGLAVGVAMAELLPAGVLALQSTRSDVTYQFVASGIPLQDYLQLLLPGAFSQWVPQFAGLATFVLALIAWLGRKQSPTAADGSRPGHSEILFWSATALLAGWLALGDAGILFQAAYRLLPGFSLFRQQERLLGLVSLSLALLAAQGLALWWQASRETRRQWTRKAVLVSAGLLLLGLVYLALDPNQAGQPWPALWLRQAAGLALVWLLLGDWLPRLRPSRSAPLLIGLLAIDLYLGTLGSIGRQLGSPNAYWPTPGWLQRLQANLAAEPLARIDSRNLFHANLGPLYGLEDVHSISPLKLRRLAEFQKLPITVRWQLLGVRYVLDYAPPDPAALPVDEIKESIYPDRTIYAQVFRYDQPRPRAWLAYRTTLVNSPEEARQRLAAPDFDPAGEVVLHTPLPELAAITPPATPPSVETTRLDGRTLRIRVQTATPGFLVISEWDYPGWQMRRDGQRVPLYPADFALQGVFAPAGSHEFILQFRPWDVPMGVIISLAALLAGLLLAGRWQPAIPRRAQPAAKPVPAAAAAPRPGLALILHRHWRPLLLALTLLGYGLRMAHLGLQELRGDEAYSYPFTTMPLRDVLPNLVYIGEEHAPLHYLLLNLWTGQFGDSEFVMRYLAVIPAVLGIPLVYFLGRRVGGVTLGFLVASLVTVSQSLVWLGQDVRNQYVATIFFSTLATLLLLRAVARPGWRQWGWYALACALTMYSHYYGIFALLAHGLYLVAEPAHRRHLRRWVPAGLLAAILFGPWALVTVGVWGNQFFEPGQPQLADFLVTVGRELTVGPAFDHALGRWLFVAALLLALNGVRLLWARQRGMAAMLGGWLALNLLGVFLVYMRRDTFNAYYVAPSAPAWWTLIGVSLLSLAQSRRPAGRWLAAVAALAFFLAAAWSLSHYYGDPVQYGRTRGNRALAAHIAQNQQPGDLFVANFPQSITEYYLRGLDLPQTLAPAQSPQPAAETEAALAQLAATADRIWFMPVPGTHWDPEQVAARWLDYHTLVEESQQFTDLTLTAYRPEHAVAQVMMPIGLTTAGGSIRLAGAYLTVNGQRVDLGEVVTLPAGAALSVTLIWDALAAVPADYTVFVHLLGADGQLVAQHDGTPLFGTRPTSTWQPGERLLDRHDFVLPEGVGVPAGVLRAGLYLPATLERLPFSHGEDGVQLAGVLFQ